MVYYYASIIAVVSIILFALGLFFFRNKAAIFLVCGIICIGFLSFYIFYYISSYSSSPEEVAVDRNLTKANDGCYILSMHIAWNKKPEIFGLDGDDDLLILRYNPKEVEVLSSNKVMNESQTGRATIKLSKDFKYSKIEKNEREVSFRLKDGTSSDISVTFKSLVDKVPVKIFYIHDYNIPLEGAAYWEKDEELDLISLAK